MSRCHCWQLVRLEKQLCWLAQARPAAATPCAAIDGLL